MNIDDQTGDFKATRWVRVSVEMLEHPGLDVGPYDRRSAWLWLVANACWKPRRVNHKGRIVTLERGQLFVARDFLAKTWRWSPQQVRTFITHLQRENMLEINQSGGHWANVATICNYDKYQSPQPEKDQLINQSLTSVQPEPNQTLTKNTNITNNTPLPPKGGGAPKSIPKFGRQDALECFHAYNAVALRCGLPQASKMTPGRERSIIARLKEHGREAWDRALANIEKSTFLTGGTDRGFRADLDFVCQAKSFSRLHDGGYGNGRHVASAPAGIPVRRKSPEEIYAEDVAWARAQGIIDAVAN